MIEHQSQNRDDIIRRILSEVEQKLPPKKLALIKLFIADYYSTASLDILNAYGPSDLYGAAVNFWNFMSPRKPGEPKLHIYNPHLEQSGWESTHTMVDLNCDDMPFLVDSIRMELTRQGYSIHNLIHFGRFMVKRDSKNNITEIMGKKSDKNKEGIHADSLSEAVIHFEVDRQTDPDALKLLEEKLYEVLRDVTVAVQDWQSMRDKIQCLLDGFVSKPPPGVNTSEIAETVDFLRWIKDDNFTFLGCRDYKLIEYQNEPALEIISGSGLGVLRDETHSKPVRILSDLPDPIRELVLSPQQILILTKTNTLATVHRMVYTDYIGVKRYGPKGEVIGETRIIGLYTTVAYNSHPNQIPFLRHKVDSIFEMSGLPPTGHAGKDLLNILETLPRDDLFHASVEELYDLSMGILQLQERKVVRLFVRKDIYGRFISCLVYVPRDNFNSEIRQMMQDILFRAFDAIEITFDTRFSESVLARIHFTLRVDPKKPLNYDLKQIEAELTEVSRTWEDDLKDDLIDYFGEEQGTVIFREYGSAFPAAYRDDFHPRGGVHDIVHMKNLSAENVLEMAFYKVIDDPDDVLRFKLFHAENTIPLSDVVPMLENMGLRVIGERPYEITSMNNHAWINDFTMQSSGNNSIDLEATTMLFQEAFAKVWYGQAENDGFNKLVLRAHLNWRQVAVLRAYAKYLRQTGFMFSQQYIETTLSDYPLIARRLIELFEVSFSIQRPKDLTQKVLDIEKSIHEQIENVSSLDEDRILRRYLDVIHATLRTNYLLDKDYLSFKLNPHAIPEIPLPLPLYEVFVYSPRFEAVHLRAAKVARGGIRWSDRREDFRTEILGLMKAQKVKNSVIVPSGAKGGFVPKCLPENGTREEIMAEVISCYKNFMRGLLDITDNFVQGKVVSPANIVCFDDNDPYLVVAADKGTASFSDIANSISKEYGFWLGDAFASGGSAGYDHKKMGITARGAWESVKRHFNEMAVDIQSTDFTVIGIGDMSGDVFGNGMLLSEHIKLVAAFDHRNIFLDPNPNPKQSFAERKRLFELPRSSWEDYDAKLISAGGGVFKRSAKSIVLTPEVKALFGLETDQIAPNDLIKVLLTASVDLLWNGGIGTYIKASTERHADIGDRTNDFVRVNGNELRAKVLGEGGNLGCSQLGRVEYALNGGRCNTDFIDNSAGVDCSDHEVNIKILLNEVVAKSDLTEKQRNKLLAEMTDEVAELVLRDNYQQALAISLAHVHAKTHPELYRRYLADQEKANLIDRNLEFLPSDKELVERKIQNISFTRPELAVLLSYSKINLKAAILATDLPEDDYLKHSITTAFPHMLQKKYSSQIMVHRLRREIIATQISSHLVNQMGAVFIYRMQDEMGVTVGEVIKAYSSAFEIFNIEHLYELISSLSQKVSAEIQIEMLLHVKRLLRRATRWLLRNRRTQLDVKSCISYFGGGVAKIVDVIPALMVGVSREYMDNLTAQFVAAGLSPAVASRIAGCRAMYTALNIVDLATEHKFDLVEAAKVFFAVGAKLELAWFRDQLNAHSLEDYWDSIARASLRDDLDVQQRIVTISILQHNKDIKNIDKRFETWMSHYEPLLQRWSQVLVSMRGAATLSFIMFYVAVRELYDITSVITQTG